KKGAPLIGLPELRHSISDLPRKTVQFFLSASYLRLGRLPILPSSHGGSLLKGAEPVDSRRECADRGFELTHVVLQLAIVLDQIGDGRRVGFRGDQKVLDRDMWVHGVLLRYLSIWGESGPTSARVS